MVIQCPRCFSIDLDKVRSGNGYHYKCKHCDDTFYEPLTEDQEIKNTQFYVNADDKINFPMNQIFTQHIQELSDNDKDPRPVFYTKDYKE